MKENWIIQNNNKEQVVALSEKYGINSKIIEILESRGICLEKDIDKFLKPTLQDFYTPFNFKDMVRAVTRIKLAKKNREKIGIFADSDLDGITSLTLLKSLFDKLNIEIEYEFPSNDEGYGMNTQTINSFYDKGVSLIITVDSGIRDNEAISLANSFDIDVIITDHHEQAENLPNAIIINPKTIKSSYPFNGLAGVGVAFKLAHAVLISFLPVYNKKLITISDNNDSYDLTVMENGVIVQEKKLLSLHNLNDFLNDNDSSNQEKVIIVGGNCKKLNEIKIEEKRKISDFFNLTTQTENSLKQVISELPNLRFDSLQNIDNLVVVVKFISLFSTKITTFFSEILPYVSLGTIADIMPLLDENRALVAQGLLNFKKINHLGLKKLTADVSFVDSRFVSWEISPLLNTPGRLGKTEMTVDFFINENEKNFENSLQELKILNNQRKKILRDLITKITKNIDDNEYDNTGGLLLIRSDEISPGLTGLVANRIAEYACKPVIVLSELKDSEFLRGSGRSGVELSFFDFVKKYTDSFYKIGGHSQAFGFSIHKDKVSEVFKKISDDLSLQGIPLSKMEVDTNLDLSQITQAFIKSLLILEPFGKANPQPTFITREVRIIDFRLFGENNSHVALVFSKKSKRIDAIGWNLASKFDFNFDNILLDVVYHLEINRFRGVSTPRMVIIDIDFS